MLVSVITAQLFCSAIVGFVFYKMATSYTKKRANAAYARGKVKAPSLDNFRTLSKLLFVTSMLLTLASYWFVQKPALWFFHDALLWRLLGALMVLFGYFGLQHALLMLDKNYSPLFDAYQPFSLTRIGVYRLIRHPIYLFNLLVSFGLALSSGLYFVLMNALIGFGFVLRAAVIEERCLKQQFSEYEAYCATTWWFVPYIV